MIKSSFVYNVYISIDWFLCPRVLSQSDAAKTHSSGIRLANTEAGR